MRPKVFCIKCRHLLSPNATTYRCQADHNTEKGTKTSWLQETIISVEYFKEPSEINRDNDCKWYHYLEDG